jgi:threonine/homoserine/homoserine lactone efflux protein
MSPGVFLALTATVATVALVPGPAVAAIVARAVADGARPALAVAAGVVTGDLLMFVLAAAGMAAAATSLGDGFRAVQLIGAAYLAWQGIQLWRRPPRAMDSGDGRHERHFWRNYGSGLLLMLGHVQAMLFYAALLPGFVDLATLDWPDLALLAAMLVTVFGGVNAGYALLAARARRLFASARAQRAIGRAAGALMLVAAALVASRV